MFHVITDRILLIEFAKCVTHVIINQILPFYLTKLHFCIFCIQSTIMEHLSDKIHSGEFVSEYVFYQTVRLPT